MLVIWKNTNWPIFAAEYGVWSMFGQQSRVVGPHWIGLQMNRLGRIIALVDEFIDPTPERTYIYYSSVGAMNGAYSGAAQKQ